jgi:hypothetical protein
MSAPEEKKGERQVTDRWWFDTDRRGREAEKAPPKPEGPTIGSRFYRCAEGYNQDRAHARLTDINLKILIEGNPPEGGLSVLTLAERPLPQRERDQLLARVKIPPYARAVAVDSGRSLRIIITGTPVGQRILEMTLGKGPTFDCWVGGEWIRESFYGNTDEALKVLPGLIEEYLSPEGIARWSDVHVQS